MIKWITPYLGTTSAFNANLEKYSYLDVRDLYDGCGNNINFITKLLDEAIKLLHQQKKLVVYCHYGMSRSNAIAAGILAKYNNISFNEAIRQVLKETNETKINLDIVNSVRIALNESTSKVIPSNILITGASGFIGKKFISHLKNNNFNAIETDRNSINLLEDLIKLELLIKEQNINKIVHLAAPRIYTSNQSLGESLIILKNILDVCAQNNLHLYYLSCWTVYRQHLPEQTPLITEDTPISPQETYGVTKALSENLIQYYKNIYNLKYSVIRSCPIYSEEQGPKFIFNFFEKAIKNLPIILHKYLNGFTHLPLLYIDDLLFLLTKFISIENPPQSMIMSSETSYSIFDIATTIKELCKSSSEITYQEMRNNAFQSKFSIEKMKRLLKFYPQVSLEKGLEKIKDKLFT